MQKAKPAEFVNMYAGLKSGVSVSGFSGNQNARAAREIKHSRHNDWFLAVKSFSPATDSQSQNAATMRNIIRFAMMTPIP